MLELQSLTKVYTGSKRALDEVNLTVGPGEIVGLFGENGAGKTTLMKCVFGFLPHDGKILLDGTPKEVFSHVELLKERGLDVPQSTDLADELAGAGYSIDRTVLTEEECADALAALLEAHGIHSTKNDGKEGVE